MDDVRVVLKSGLEFTVRNADVTTIRNPKGGIDSVLWGRCAEGAPKYLDVTQITAIIPVKGER